MKRAAALVVAGMAIVVVATEPAAAYRPFEGTDADVADYGALDLELGPVEYLREGRDGYLVVPNVVFNLGIVPRVELVLEGMHLVGLQAVANQDRNRLLDSALLLKWVVLQGELQEQRGPSIALEAGALLPEKGGETGPGASLAGILSKRWSFGTAHFNQEILYARAAEFEFVSGLIMEGPEAWRVRPVAELEFAWTQHGSTAGSALIGAIWPLNDALSFDVGVRVGRGGGETSEHVLLGFTWSAQVWGGSRAPLGLLRTRPVSQPAMLAALGPR
jgi:hypothetical protein